MLDWQNKKWIKVIAITVVVTFLTYDIAWAMDFSPLAVSASPSETSPKLLTRVNDFISNKILKRPHEEKESEDTEIVFRTQLVPRKKYGEESGFLRLEATRDAIKRQMEWLRRHQRIEEERRQRDFTIYNVNKGLYMDNVEKSREAQDITEKVMKARGETFEGAAALSEFNYVLNKDGSSVYYKDGLPARILNEPITDSTGNVSIKNTVNMQYSDRRLMFSYDADITDSFGSVTNIQWRNGRYSDDSVWYGGGEGSILGKYLTGYTEIITDPYGTTMVREWSTTRDSYDDKKVSSYSEIMKDASGTILSTSQYSNCTYDGDNLSGYHMESEDAYGNVNITNWDGRFDGDRMLESHSIDEQINKDGTSSVSENRVTYDYDSGNKLIGAIGETSMEGAAHDINGLTIYTYKGTSTQHYEILNNQLKLMYTTTEMSQENADSSTSHTSTRFDYVYNDKNLVVDASEISKVEGKDMFGSRYTSETVSEYDVIASQPRRVSSDTHTESETMFGNMVTTDSHVEYRYDELGKFKDEGAFGYSDTVGLNLFGENFSTHTVNEYEIINGQPRLKAAETGPNIPNPAEDLGTMLSEIEEILFGIAEAQKQGKEEDVAQAVRELGMEPQSIVRFTMEKVQAIMAWLWKASTNVINCAVEALKNIFTSRGIEVSEVEIAKDAILADVLAGVITPENAKGKLNLSFYAMQEAAEKQGVALEGANITIDQLKNINQPVIARFAVRKHFIVITQATDAEVTYIDNGTEVTEDITEFSYKWDGNILAAFVPQGVSALSIPELQNITGAKDPAEEDPLKGFGHNDAYTEIWGPGFHLWKDQKTNPTWILYETSGDNGTSRTEVNKVSGDIKIDTDTDKSHVNIHAKRDFNSGEPGVIWADYKAENKEDNSITIARVQRDGNSYHIDGLSWSHGGFINQMVTLDRVIGGAISDRHLYVVRNDAEYSSANWGPNTFNLSDIPSHIESITAACEREEYYGFWKKLEFKINEKSFEQGGLYGSDGAITLTLNLDRDWDDLDVNDTFVISVLPEGELDSNYIDISGGNGATIEKSEIKYLSSGDAELTVKVVRNITVPTQDTTYEGYENYNISTGNPLTQKQVVAEFTFVIDYTPEGRLTQDVSGIIAKLKEDKNGDDQRNKTPTAAKVDDGNSERDRDSGSSGSQDPLDAAPTTYSFTQRVRLCRSGPNALKREVEITREGFSFSGNFSQVLSEFSMKNPPYPFAEPFNPRPCPSSIRAFFQEKTNQTLSRCIKFSGAHIKEDGVLLPKEVGAAGPQQAFLGSEEIGFTSNVVTMAPLTPSFPDAKAEIGQVTLSWIYPG
ncbi:MAG: cysteine peptidase family C39 domain-containing protein, partial [Pseudomonadota bacterium]